MTDEVRALLLLPVFVGILVSSTVVVCEVLVLLGVLRKKGGDEP